MMISAGLLVSLTSCAPIADVYFTASLNGNLAGCDCWGYPEAGLDKRARFLKAQRPAPDALLLDAGNVLEAGREPFLAGLIMETYGELGYDAVAVGTHELAEGPDILAERTRTGSRPAFLAHNLDLDGRSLSSEPLYGKGGTSFPAVVALADPEWFAPYLPAFNRRLTIADPLVVLTRQRALAAESGAPGVVLLAHGSAEWARALAADAREADRRAGTASPGVAPLSAIILAGEERLLEEKLPGGIPLLSPGEEGNRMGILNLRLRPRRPGWTNRYVEFHYLEPGDPRTAARGDLYAAHLDGKRTD